MKRKEVLTCEIEKAMSVKLRNERENGLTKKNGQGLGDGVVPM